MFTPSYGGTFLLFQFYIQRIGFSVYIESSMLGTQRFHFAPVLRSQNWQTSLWYIYWNIANYFSDTFFTVKKWSVNLIYNNSFFFFYHYFRSRTRPEFQKLFVQLTGCMEMLVQEMGKSLALLAAFPITQSGRSPLEVTPLLCPCGYGAREINKNNLLGGQFLIFLIKNPGK